MRNDTNRLRWKGKRWLKATMCGLHDNMSTVNSYRLTKIRSAGSLRSSRDGLALLVCCINWLQVCCRSYLYPCLLIGFTQVFLILDSATSDRGGILLLVDGRITISESIAGVIDDKKICSENDHTKNMGVSTTQCVFGSDVLTLPQEQRTMVDSQPTFRETLLIIRQSDKHFEQR